MAEAEAQSTSQDASVEEGSMLDSLLNLVDPNIQAPTEIKKEAVDDPFADSDKSALLTLGIDAFLKAVGTQEVERIDKDMLSELISSIDQKISEQLDEVMHNETFKQVEAAWRGLRFMVDRTDFRRNIQIEILNVSKKDLTKSFFEANELIQSPLYKKVYTDVYDQFGANPYGAIVSAYEFDSSAPDMALLEDVAKVSAAAHCPFIGAIGPKFFNVSSMEEWRKIPDLGAHLATTDYVKWNSLRTSEDARYLGLVFPRFLLRLPYDPENNPVDSFNYVENVKGPDHEKYAWGNASFAFASNMIRAFMEDGWCVQIRGPESGGTVDKLPVHVYDIGKGSEMKIPTEIPIGETLEYECANLGFMPFCHYQGKDFASFISANSAQLPKNYDDVRATENSKINTRLPYIFLVSRIAHYLKIMQRREIGSTKSRLQIEEELNTWLKGLVTETPNPSAKIRAQYPLRAAQVNVFEVEGNPGFYRVETMVMPHFQIEGMDVNLSLVSKMPS